MITRLCRKCGEQHPVFYFVNAKQTHLVMICGREWTYAPYEEGLAIEVVYSKALRRVEKAHRQMDEECDGARDRDRRGDKKYRPGWDDAAFIMRSDPEREKKPRLKASKLELPEPGKFSMEKCLKAWRSIGLTDNEQHILEHLERLERWQRRK